MKVNVSPKTCSAAMAAMIFIAAGNLKAAQSNPVDQSGNIFRQSEKFGNAASPYRKTAADCEIPIDNYTGWTIKIYIDGYYRGTVGAYDEMKVYYERTNLKIYLRADFADGTYRYWGPLRLNCRDRQNIFRITD